MEFIFYDQQNSKKLTDQHMNKEKQKGKTLDRLKVVCCRKTRKKTNVKVLWMDTHEESIVFVCVEEKDKSFKKDDRTMKRLKRLAFSVMKLTCCVHHLQVNAALNCKQHISVFHCSKYYTVGFAKLSS